MARFRSTIQFPPLALRTENRNRRAPSLRRRGARREPRRRFILFCEGRNTEPAYFDALRRACSSALVAVEARPGVGVPYTIATRAVEHARDLGLGRRRRRKKDSYEEADQVWAVFDRDEHPRFNEAVAHCESNGIGVARSDPCFELWLILHERDHDRPDHRRAVQEVLEELRPEYDADGAKTPDCDNLVTRVEQAEQRADTQLRRREQEGNPFGNPSTTVGRLTRAIREADELAR